MGSSAFRRERGRHEREEREDAARLKAKMDERMRAKREAQADTIGFHNNTCIRKNSKGLREKQKKKTKKAKDKKDKKAKKNKKKRRKASSSSTSSSASDSSIDS